jgi:hypothetical protein
MSNETYTLRWRGNVSGPFSVQQLQAMLANGEISLMHEVLSNQRWISLEQLLEESSPTQSQPKSAPADPIEESSPADDKTNVIRTGPPPPPPEEEFYVAKNGQQQGPYTKAMVRQMAAAGVFDREDLIWKQGLPSWMELGKFLPDILRPLTGSSYGNLPLQPIQVQESRNQDQLVQLFIGSNKEYYLTKWQRAEEGHRKYSWNWAAFFLGVGWMGYRKMFRNAWLILLGLLLLRACEIGFSIPDNRTLVLWIAIYFCFGLWANHLYKVHVERKVAEIVASSPSAEAARLRVVCDGRTNIWAGVGINFLLGLVMAFLELARQGIVRNI